MMENVLPVFLCLLWHVFVLGAGVWLGINKPWRWKVIRPEGEQPAGHTRQREETFGRVR